MNVITMSAIAVTLFLGGPSGPSLGFLSSNNVVNVWLMPMFWFLVKVLALLFATVWVRASLPRMRYDRLMSLGWKWLIEIAILWVLVTATVAGRDRRALGPSRRRAGRGHRRGRRVRRAVRGDAEVGREASRSSADGALLRFPRDAAPDGQAAPHHRVPEGEARQARAHARPARPQPLRGRHGEVHRLRAVRRRVPGALHLRARRRQPDRRSRCRPASATASSTRSTTCAASTATCASRRARPRRSPRPSCSSSRSRTAATRSTRRTSSWSTTTAAPGGCRGSCGSGGEDDHTSAWMRATVAVGFERVRRPRQLVGRARLRRAPARARAASRHAPERRAAGRLVEAVIFFVCAAAVIIGALGVIARPQPGALRAVPAAHAGQRRGAVSPAERRARRRDPDRRLRERDRRAVPVRDHAARRRQARSPRRRRIRCSAPPAFVVGVLVLTGILVLVHGNRWVTGRALDAGRARHPAESGNVETLAKSLFTDFVWAFEITAVLLVIAVVGSVVLARRSGHRAERATRPSRRPSRADGAVSALAYPEHITPTYYLILAAMLFTIGAVGLLVRKNTLVMFMCIELMLNAANLTFVSFAKRPERHQRPGDRVLHAGRRRGRGGGRSRDHHRHLPAPPVRQRRRRRSVEGLRRR